MLSDKVKRNIWLTFAVLSALSVVNRAIRLADGTAEWWQLCSSVVITAACVIFYLDCRRKVSRRP